MQVVASPSACARIAERGGRLYVSVRRSRCCGGSRTLDVAHAAPDARAFRRVDDEDRFELYLPAYLARLPDELVIDVHGGRVEAFWNGCAWVT
jgi:hypothetical protein